MDNLNESKSCCGGKEEARGHGVMGHKHCVKAAFGVLAVVLTIFIGLKSYNAYLESKYIGKDVMAQNNISVEATGEVFAKPDIAQTSMSVVERAKTVVEAQRAHSVKMDKIVKFLKDSGIEDKDIKTTSYNISEDYNYTQMGGRILLGYVVSQSLEVKVRKMDEAGKILAGATEQGANEVGGVSFVFDDEDVVKAQARKKAIDEAKAKAENIAKDLGVKLVRIVNFSESGSSPVYMARDFAIMGAGEAKSSPSPVVPVGENKIVVSVMLTYEIR